MALTDSPAAAQLCSAAGAHSVEAVGASGAPDWGLPWPQPAAAAASIAERLGGGMRDMFGEAGWGGHGALPCFRDAVHAAPSAPSRLQSCAADQARRWPPCAGVPFVRLPEAGGEAALPGLAALAAPMPGSAAAPQQQRQQQQQQQEGAGPQREQAAAPGEEETDPDMLMLFLDASPAAAAGQPGADAAPAAAAAAALAWLDALLAALNRVEGFRDTVLLSVVLGAQPALAGRLVGRLAQERRRLLGAGAGEAGGAARRWPFRRPLQSYEFRGLEAVEPSTALAALAVHRLPGVIRCVVASLRVCVLPRRERAGLARPSQNCAAGEQQEQLRLLRSLYPPLLCSVWRCAVLRRCPWVLQAGRGDITGP